MPQLSRPEMEARYRMFDHFALDDQRSFYDSSVSKYRASGFQVNTYRAFFSLLTGLASALAGVLVTTAIPAGQCTAGDSSCAFLSAAVIVLLILSVVAPAIGGAFGTLADLYQWDRLVTVYSNALENIEVADSRSPDDEMEDMKFRAALVAYVDGTLSVMRDESAQWGQLIRTPPQLEKFLHDEEEKATKASGQNLDNDSQSAAQLTTPAAAKPLNIPQYVPPAATVQPAQVQSAPVQLAPAQPAPAQPAPAQPTVQVSVAPSAQPSQPAPAQPAQPDQPPAAQPSQPSQPAQTTGNVPPPPIDPNDSTTAG